MTMEVTLVMIADIINTYLHSSDVILRFHSRSHFHVTLQQDMVICPTQSWNKSFARTDGYA